ncbi:MAG: hypothetical protein ACP5UA_13165 [Candidatus Hydrogenedens sp.]
MRTDFFKGYGILLIILFCFFSTTSFSQEMQALIAYSNGTIIKLTEENKKSIFGDESLHQKDLFTANGITFNMTYQDINTGFNDPTLGSQRKAVLQSALEYVSSVLNTPGGRVDINVSSVVLAGQYLATAGPIVVWYLPLTPGINNGCVFQHLLNGSVDPSGPDYPDMQLTVNWNYNYYLGTGDPGPMQFDLLSILIHELTHGIGFLSSIAYNDSVCGGGARPNGTGWTGSQPDIYSAFDTFLVTGNGNYFINSSFYYTGQNSYFLGGDNGVYCAGTEATTVWGTRPRIYAPSIFECGSSISHWNSLGAVMDPSIPPGVKKRNYLPFEVAFLRDMGYVNASIPSTEGEGMIEGEGIAEGEGEPAGCNYITDCPDFIEEGNLFYTELSNRLGNPTINWNISDLDGSGIPDSWEVALLKKILCQPAVYWRLNATCVYLENLSKIRTEPQYELWLHPYEHILAGLLSISSEFQSVFSILNLVNEYQTIKNAEKTVNEILSGWGDADRDGYSNRTEYNNCIIFGLGLNDYLIVALHPDLDGTEAPQDALSVGQGMNIVLYSLPILILGFILLLSHQLSLYRK